MQPPPGDHPPPAWGGYPPPGYGGYPPPPYGYPPQPPTGLVALPGFGIVAVATIWQRLLARLIDVAIVGVVYAVCFGIAFAVMAANMHPTTQHHHHHHQPGNEPPSWAPLLFLVAIAIATLAGLVYEWLMIGLNGATLGKMALRIRVVNDTTGLVPGLGSSFVRSLIPFLANWFCSVLVLLVYLSPLFDGAGRLQGWHDKAAKDLVLKLP